MELNQGKPILFKTSKLTGYEILYEFNKLVLPLVVHKEEAVTASKGAKMIAGGASAAGYKKKK